MISLKPLMRSPILILILFLVSCRAYKQDIMFRLDDNFTAADLAIPISQAEQNYHLQPDDYIVIDVYTNKGERVVDPNMELAASIGNQSANLRKDYQYLIQIDGTVKLPVIDKIKLEGLTVDEAERVLEQAFNDYYKDSFVKISLANRRVVVLGANGGQVIPIVNENTTLVEILALYGGLNLGAKVANIKLIRGELSAPTVYQIDLSTLRGMQSTIVEVEAGDIVYVEPWRRPWVESLKDFSPVLSLASSVLTLIVVVQNLAR